MITNPKSSTEAPPESRENPAGPDMLSYTPFAALTHRGVEKLAETQKLSVDMAAKHTTDAMGVCRMTFKMPAEMPGMFLLDLAEQTLERMAQAQKELIDLIVQQSAQAMEFYKFRGDTASKWTNHMTDAFGETAERAAAAQRIVMDFAAEQNKAVAGALKKQAAVAGSPQATAAVDTIQRNIDLGIQTQKEMAQAATKPLKSTTAA
jgi:hypothetical protein